MKNSEEMAVDAAFSPQIPTRKEPEVEMPRTTSEGEEVHQEQDLEMGFIAIELVSASPSSQEGCTSSSGSDNEPAPQHDEASRPRVFATKELIPTILDSTISAIRRTDSIEDTYDSNLKPTSNFLSESSKMTVATARDMSCTDISAFGRGNKLRLSNVSESHPPPPPPPSQISSLRASLFGKAEKKKRSTSSSLSSGGEEIVDPAQKQQREVTVVDPEEKQDPNTITTSSACGEVVVPTTARTIGDSSLTDVERYQNQQDMIEREERKYMKQQIVFFVVFTVLLLGGVGICVALQIRRTR